jgi:integrase
VDLQARSIRIVRQLTNGGSTPEFGTPKGGREREIKLSDETIELLRRHKRAQAELKMANRTIYQDHGLVFSKETRYCGKDFLGLPLQSNTSGSGRWTP